MMALLATFEAWGIAKFFLASPVFPGFIAGYATIWALLVAIPVVMAAAYVVWFELTAGPMEPKAMLGNIWLVRSARLLVVYIALTFGWFATLMVYGGSSPLGPDLMRGIRTRESLFALDYWPLVFLCRCACRLVSCQIVCDHHKRAGR